MKFRTETDCAIAAARAAGALSTRRVDANFVIYKGELDIATGTDVAAEDAIRSLLQQTFPAHAIVGEERGGEPPAKGEPYWLIDPICGTESYASHLPTHASNIALVESGRVTLSAVFDGASGEVYAAERGRGAYVEREGKWHPLAARAGSVLAFELAGFPGYAEVAGSLAPFGALYAALLQRRRWHLRSLGSTLSLARVATGDFCAMLLLGRISSPLHTAAGCLLAEESGARVTDPQGAAWDLTTSELIVAASDELQRELIDLHRAAFG